MDPAILRRLALVAPSPLAQLAQRAQNDCSPERQHHNSYYLFELWLRLFAAIAMQRYRRSEDRLPALEKMLQGLVRPSVGGFANFIKNYLKEFPADPLLVLWSRLVSPEMAAGYRWACEKCGMKQRLQGTVGNFVDVLSTYRNKHLGHGALHDSAFYQRGATALFNSVGELVCDTAEVVAGRLLCVEEVLEDVEGVRVATVFDHTGAFPTRLPEPVPESALSPGVRKGFPYFQPNEGPALCLYPLLLWHDGQLLCLNRTTQTQVEYLNYLTGENIRLASPVDALRRFLDSEAALPQRFEDTRHGKWIGAYQIQSEIGRGGMSTVYLARQASLDMPVALKLLPREFDKDEVALARFKREVDILKRCEHPNIVSVLDAGVDDGRHFYVMELVVGCSLADIYRLLTHLPAQIKQQLKSSHVSTAIRWRQERKEAAALAERPSPEEDSAAFLDRLRPADQEAEVTEPLWRLMLRRFAEVADALGYLHERGVIHRDIKPSNIMLTTDGQKAVVMDLGIAKAETGSIHTKTGTFVGTLRYASREQVVRSLEDLDFRADLYSLGATMYELLTLTPLYTSDETTASGITEPAMIRMVLDERPAPALERNPALRREIGIILEKLLEKQPERRFYTSARELAADLRNVCDQRAIRAREYTTGERRAFELYDSLCTQADTWNRERRSPDLLWGEERADELQQLGVRDGFVLSDVELAFFDATIAHAENLRRERQEREQQQRALEESARAHERESRRQRARVRRVVVGALLGVLLLAAATAGLFLYRVSKQRDEARARWVAALVKEGERAERATKLDEAALFYAAALQVQDVPRAREGLQREVTVPFRTRLRWSRLVPRADTMAMSYDGRLIAAVGQESGIHILDATRCGAPKDLPSRGEGKGLLSVAFSPDGRWVAAGAQSGTTLLWDTATWRALELRSASRRTAVRALAFSGDGETLFVGGDDGNVWSWNTRTREEFAGVIMSLHARVTAIAVAPGGGLVAAATTEGLKAVDLAAPDKPPREGRHTGEVFSLCFTRTHLVSGGADEEIRVWDVTDEKAKLHRSLKRHTGDVWTLACPLDAPLLASGSEDNTVRLWSSPGFDLERTFAGFRDEVAAVALSRDGTRLATMLSDGMLELREIARPPPSSDRVESPLRGCGDAVENVVFSPQGTRLAHPCDDGTLWIWNLVNGGKPRLFQVGEPQILIAAVFSPDGQRIASANVNTLRLWNSRSGEHIRDFALGDLGEVMYADFAPDGTHVAFATFSGGVGIWDLEKNALRSWEAHKGTAHSIRFSPDGLRVATAGDDSVVRVWDRASLRQLHELKGHTGRVSEAIYSRGGRYIVSGGKDRHVRLWDASTGKKLHSLAGHTAQVFGVAISPDDRWIASASGDATVGVWDRASGKLLRMLRSHQAPAYSVYFSPDSRILASAGEDRTVRLWDTGTWRERNQKGNEIFDTDRRSFLRRVEARTGLEIEEMNALSRGPTCR